MTTAARQKPATEIEALIGRLRFISGPDRELDGLIAVASFKSIGTDDNLIYRAPVRRDDNCAPGTYWHVERSGRSLRTAPAYTASLDAALTLLPANTPWRAGWHEKMAPNELGSHAVAWVHGVGGVQPNARTVPAALCIAALKKVSQS